LVLTAKKIDINTTKTFLHHSNSTYFEFSSSYLSKYVRADTP